MSRAPISLLSDYHVLAERTPAQIAAYLRAIGDSATADAVAQSGAAGGQALALPFQDHPWRCANHVLGFVELPKASGLLPIKSALSIKPQGDLVGQAIKINLNKFHVSKYPGWGVHRILLEFAGRNQAGTEREDLRFTTTCEVKDDDSMGGGQPIFTGVHVPADGLAFEGRTVILCSSGDDMILDILKSAAFKQGLTLLGVVQPALPLLTKMSAGVVDHLIKKSKNAVVQRFTLGLDFSGSGTSAQLRLGSYVVAQVPDDGAWNWDDWKYDQDSMSIVKAGRHNTECLAANYMIFGVSQSSAAQPSSAQRGATAKRSAAKSASGSTAARPRATT